MIKVYDIRGEDDLRLAKIKNRQYFVVLYFFALTSWYADENETKKKKKNLNQEPKLDLRKIKTLLCK